MLQMGSRKAWNSLAIDRGGAVGNVTAADPWDNVAAAVMCFVVAGLKLRVVWRPEGIVMMNFERQKLVMMVSNSQL